MRILLSGCTGFVGRALATVLLDQGREVVGAVRTLEKGRELAAAGLTVVAVGELNGETSWRKALAGCGQVVHLAARAHLPADHPGRSLSHFRRVNTAGTSRLASEAAAAGVKRFVYLSSVKVHGEGRATPYSEADPPLPTDPYGVSKWEAELELQALAKETEMEIVILRPPLVYGPGVSANFLRLLTLLEQGKVLPLGALHQKRSMVYLGNLVAAICHCLDHPRAAGETFLVSDGEALSVTELAQLILARLGRRAWLAPVPPALLLLLARLAGRQEEAARLTGSLEVDSRAIREQLAWVPPFSVEQGVGETVDWFTRRLRRPTF